MALMTKQTKMNPALAPDSDAPDLRELVATLLDGNVKSPLPLQGRGWG